MNLNKGQYQHSYTKYWKTQSIWNDATLILSIEQPYEFDEKLGGLESSHLLFFWNEVKHSQKST